MTLEELTIEIYAERGLTYFDSKHLVKWAVNVLTLGHESNNLYILAGLDHAFTEEREIYFWKSIADLKLNIEKNLVWIKAVKIKDKWNYILITFIPENTKQGYTGTIISKSILTGKQSTIYYKEGHKIQREVIAIKIANGKKSTAERKNRRKVRDFKIFLKFLF